MVNILAWLRLRVFHAPSIRGSNNEPNTIVRAARREAQLRCLHSWGAPRANQARADESPGCGACRRAAAGRPRDTDQQRCGAPGLSCTSTLDEQGNIHYYYEVEPLGVHLAEIFTGSNIRFYYTSGDDVVKVR
jgi:hypothetical protein